MLEHLEKIKKYLNFLKLELHPDKSGIHALRNGVIFLGYRIFYHYRLLRKRNIKYFRRRLQEKLEHYDSGLINKEKLDSFLQGWQGYSSFANTHNFNKKIYKVVPKE